MRGSRRLACLLSALAFAAAAARLPAQEVKEAAAVAVGQAIVTAYDDKKYADTAKWLARIEADLEQAITDLTKEQEYEGFVKSSEYAAWMKARENK